MSEFPNCSECERPVKGTPKLCVVCQASSHVTCAANTNRITLSGRFYCKQHAGLFTNVDRRSRRWTRDESEIRPRNDGEDTYYGMGSDDDEDSNNETIIPIFASTMNTSTNMEQSPQIPSNTQAPPLPPSPISQVNLAVGRSSQEINENQQSNSDTLRPQNTYRFSQLNTNSNDQNDQATLPQQEREQDTHVQGDGHNNSSIQREEIQDMISQQITALSNQWKDSFQLLLAQIGRPMASNSNQPNNSTTQIQSGTIPVVESSNGSETRPCSSEQSRIRDEARRLKHAMYRDPRGTTNADSQRRRSRATQNRCQTCKNEIPRSCNDILACRVCKSIFHLGCSNSNLVSFSPNYTCELCKDARGQTNDGLTTINNPPIDNEFLWFQENRERFERAASRFSTTQNNVQNIVSNTPINVIQPQTSEVEDLTSQDESCPEDTAQIPATGLERIMVKMCKTQELTLKRQQEIDEREKLRDLPVVHSRGSEWIVFFNAFEKSKNKFEPHENVIRLQKAIRSEEIKKLGGGNLFSPATYDITIEELNKRLSNPREMLINNVKKILKMKSPKDHPKDYKALIAFINEVRHLGNLQKKVGNASTQSDRHQIASIVQMLPEKYATSWHELCAIKEEENSPITFMLLGDCLYKKLPMLQQHLYTQELANWNDTKAFKSSEDKRRDKSREPKPGQFYNTQRADKKPWEFKCWIDKSDSHLIKDCPTARSMSGKDVMELARQSQVCVNCGKERYTGRCTKRDPAPFCRYHPDKHHWPVVCPSRHAKRHNSDENSQTRQNQNSDRPSNRSNNHDFRNSRVFTRTNNRHGNSVPNTSHNTPNVHQNLPINPSLINSVNNSHNPTSHPSPIQPSLQQNNAAPGRDVNRFFLNRSDGQINNTLHYHETNMIFQINNTTQDDEMQTSNNLLSVIVLKIGPQKIPKAFLVDSGSSISLIDEDFANSCNLSGYKYPLVLTWSGNQQREDRLSRIISVESYTCSPDEKCHKLYFHTFYQLRIGNQRFNASEMQSKYPHLRLLHLQSYCDIVGVLGTDQPKVFIQLQNFLADKRIKALEEIIGIRSPLGDYVIGSRKPISHRFDLLKRDAEIQNLFNTQGVPQNSYNFMNKNEIAELNDWEERLLGDDYYKSYEKDNNKADDEQALAILNEKTRKRDGFYLAPLIWKDENCKLPTEESFKVAYRRMRIMEKHMSKLNCYDKAKAELQNLLDKGYASLVPEEDLKNPSERTFYNPIFFVAPPEKRLRMIWDGAAEVLPGVSLNSFLLPGPNLYNNMNKILYGMREGNILIKGDIKEMFHRIGIIEEDRDALRFLFSDTPGGPVKIYRMNRMVFGLVCSPTTSQFILHKVAEEIKLANPEFAETIENDFYVDDWIKSVDNLEEGKNLVTNIRHKLNENGLQLVKLNSNNRNVFDELRETLSPDELSDEKLFANDEEEKLLGYIINFTNDSLSMATSLPKIRKIISDENYHPTRKEILKVTNSLYDPLGIFMFFTSKAKLLYHWSCSARLEWNDLILDNHKSKWKQVIEMISEIGKIQIPRNYCGNLSQAFNKQLWTFTDAGKEMQCAVAYIRCLDAHSVQIGYQIVGSKSYVVPTKQNRSIPDLEFDAVAKGLKLKEQIIEGHSFSFNEYLLVTDSSCVYEWIHNDIAKPSIYIRNREKKIKECQIPIKYIWAPTDWQVADYGTKFNSLPKLEHNNEWFHPKFFVVPEDSWPPSQPPQFSGSFLTHSTTNTNWRNCLDPTRFSTLNRALNSAQIKIAKWCLRVKLRVVERKRNQLKLDLDNRIITQRAFRYSEKSLSNDYEKILTQYYDVTFKRDEILRLFIKDAQYESLREEFDALSSNKTLPKKHWLYKLSPFLDEMKMMRTTTRLSNDLRLRDRFSNDFVNQIILPKNHHLTKLIILHNHVNNRHINEDTVVINLKQKYYIPHIKWVVKRTIREDCYFCRLKNSQPMVPMMGNLPIERLCDGHPPFSNVIVDLAGPFTVTNLRRTQKRWLFVVSCLSSRAVHIEVVHSQSTDSALKALFNTIALRGKPNVIYSDQGLNFTCALKQIKLALDENNKKLIENGLEPIQIEWVTSPAHAPHMNGSVERMIGLIKNAFKKIETMMNEKLHFLDDESFRTVVCEAIGILNNRPLCLSPIQGTSNSFLTPNHFLMGRENYKCTPLTKSPELLTKYWIEIQQINNILWQHWLKAYLPSILYRQKWINKAKPLEVGDVVVTADPSIPNSWRLGKIVQIIDGSQGQVRKVRIQLGKKNTFSNETSNNGNDCSILRAYRRENHTFIDRPATAVAAINIKAPVEI